MEGTLLNLSNQGRAFLSNVGALAIDKDGDEILIGLTVLESDYFLLHQEETDQRLIHKGSLRFHNLMQRHLIARRTALDSKEESTPPQL